MKLLNYDAKYLIMQNVRAIPKEIPSKYTLCQYRILCMLIRQKKITKKFFDYLIYNLYELSNWQELNYQQMYELIYVLTYYNYSKNE